MKPPPEGRNTGAPSLRCLQGRSATGMNRQAAKQEVSALWRGGWTPENTSGVPVGKSVFHSTSPLQELRTPVESTNRSRQVLGTSDCAPGTVNCFYRTPGPKHFRIAG